MTMEPLRKTMRSCSLAIILVLVGCTSEPAAPESAQQSMSADLCQYHDAVMEAWAYVESKSANQGVDLLASRDALLARIHHNTTQEQFAVILQEYAASLMDGHSLAMTEPLGNPFPKSWPIGFGLVKEGVIVANLNWLTDNPGVELGDRLLKVDGSPIEQYLEQRMAVTSASTELAKRLLAVDTLHQTAASSVTLTLEKDDGRELVSELKCLVGQVDYRHQERAEYCTWRTLGDGVALIRIPMFTWNETEFLSSRSDRERDNALKVAKNRIDEAFATLDENASLILDLRGNSGGFEILSSYVAEHLVAGNFIFYDSERRGSGLLRSHPAYAIMKERYFDQRLANRPRDWQGLRHFDGPPFTGNAVVLINSRCFSTTDNLCAFLRDVRPNTRFVGMPTHGGTGEPVTVLTLGNCGVPIQFCVSRIFSPNGNLIEGVGTHPDVLVEPTRADVLAHRDVAMDVAIKTLKDW